MELSVENADRLDAKRRANLITFASILFNRMSAKYGGATTLNELVLLNYGFVCQNRGQSISVTRASSDLDIPKSTVSRILTGMRAKGFVREKVDPKDKRKRIITLADTYLERGDGDIQQLLEWCADSDHALS